MGVMGILGMSIAAIILEVVIPALTAIEEITRARRKDTHNATSIRGNPIQRTARLKYPVDNYMEPELYPKLLSIARLDVAYWGDYVGI